MTEAQAGALNRLPLHDLHLALGARMVPFAGYEMPVQYPAGVMAEHLHTRTQAGLFDVSHMGQVLLHPHDGMEALALAFEALVPVDVLGLAPGRQRYGMLTDDAGGILDDLMFTNRGDHLLVVVNAACKAADLAHLRAHLAGAHVTEVTDRALLALQGPAAEAALARLLPACAGRLMQAELQALGRALAHPERPVVAVVGGAKVSTKLDLLGNLIHKVDQLVVGGAMANTFLLAQGCGIGTSLAEPDMAGTAREILDKAAAAGCEIVLPPVVVAAAAFAAPAPQAAAAACAAPADRMILDAGPDTVADLARRFEAAKTLVWNGPLGAFEIPPFDAATVAAARKAAELTRAGRLLTVAGGGDTVAALNAAGVAGDFSFVSTAGGAFLEWLEGKTLPAGRGRAGLTQG